MNLEEADGAHSMAGKLELLCGPSGVGKSSSIDGAVKSYRWTTRPKREGEIDSTKYDGNSSTHGFFVTEDEFLKRKDAGELIGVHRYPNPETGQWYGFPIEEINEALSRGEKLSEQIVTYEPIEEICDLFSQQGQVKKRLFLTSLDDIKLRLNDRSPEEYKNRVQELPELVTRYLENIAEFDELSTNYPAKFMESELNELIIKICKDHLRAQINDQGRPTFELNLDGIMGEWAESMGPKITYCPMLYYNMIYLVQNSVGHVINSVLDGFDEEFENLMQEPLYVNEKGSSWAEVPIEKKNEIARVVIGSRKARAVINLVERAANNHELTSPLFEQTGVGEFSFSNFYLFNLVARELQRPDLILKNCIDVLKYFKKFDEAQLEKEFENPIINDINRKIKKEYQQITDSAKRANIETVDFGLARDQYSNLIAEVNSLRLHMEFMLKRALGKPMILNPRASSQLFYNSKNIEHLIVAMNSDSPTDPFVLSVKGQVAHARKFHELTQEEQQQRKFSNESIAMARYRVKTSPVQVAQNLGYNLDKFVQRYFTDTKNFRILHTILKDQILPEIEETLEYTERLPPENLDIVEEIPFYVDSYVDFLLKIIKGYAAIKSSDESPLPYTRNKFGENLKTKFNQGFNDTTQMVKGLRRAVEYIKGFELK